MTEGREGFNMWVPEPGQMVRIKANIDPLERMAMRRAGIDLDPDKRFEVLEYIQDAEHRALRICELIETGNVQELNIAGNTIKVHKYAKGESFTLAYKYFEPYRK